MKSDCWPWIKYPKLAETHPCACQNPWCDSTTVFHWFAMSSPSADTSVLILHPAESPQKGPGAVGRIRASPWTCTAPKPSGGSPEQHEADTGHLCTGENSPERPLLHPTRGVHSWGFHCKIKSRLKFSFFSLSFSFALWRSSLLVLQEKFFPGPNCTELNGKSA